MILIIYFLKKILDEMLWFNVFKGIVLFLKFNLLLICKIIWENIEFVLFIYLYGICIYKVFGGIYLKEGYYFWVFFVR